MLGNLWRNGLLAVLLGTILFSSVSAQAGDLRRLPWDEAEGSLREELKTLKGSWSDEANWQGYLCNGRYYYLFTIEGQVAKLELNLTDKGTVEIDTEIRQVYTYAKGGYKSAKTLCVPTNGWLGAGSDWAKVKAEVSFPEDSKDLKNITIVVKSTELGQLHLGKYVPTSFETYLTRQANRGLAKVWATVLGKKLNTWITEMVRRKFPQEEAQHLAAARIQFDDELAYETATAFSAE